MKEEKYYSWEIARLLAHFETDPKFGLSEEKALSLLQKHGPNVIRKPRDISAAKIFFRQFSNLFILLLFVAGIVSYFNDGIFQTTILFLIIIINIALGFFQEYKAEKSILDLEKSYHSNTSVIRGGEIRNIENEKIALGDLVELTAGNKIPADLRITEADSLQIDEATLTGESIPVEKSVDVKPVDTALANRNNMAYAGSLVSSGHGKGIVVAIGNMTEFGKIADLIETDEEKTHLERGVLYLSKVLGLIAFVLAIVVFVLGYMNRQPIWELATFTIALLVGMVPESLPTAITLALSVGVSRMAKKKAIVRRLAATETLGSVNIIATDKTGTLTKNNLTLSKIAVFNQNSLVERKIDGTPEVVNTLFFASLCSNENYGADPLDLAILSALEAGSKEKSGQKKSWKRIDEIPFSSEKKYMAVVAKNAESTYIIVKGAAEKLIELCDLTQKQQDQVKNDIAKLNQSGFKVIAVAKKKVKTSALDSLKNLDLLGCLAFSDEASFGVKEAIRKTIDAGIRPVIITGDHPETARYLAKEIGLETTLDEIILGEQFVKMSKAELVKSLKRVKIFARVTPEDKINIVKALQENGFCVAMTGDGTNDAPALKRADIGISMGIRGTDVAKDASDIILADDHYGTIVSAVEYGRTIQDNIRNVISLLISGNFNEVILIITAFVFSLPVPFLTMQLLWANMITENFSAITLAFEKPKRGILKQKPRPVNTDSLRSSIRYALFLSIISFVFSLCLYLWGLSHSVEKARTMIFTFIVFVELSYAFSIRNREPIWSNIKDFFENKLLVYGTIAVGSIQVLLFFTPLQKVFGIVNLTLVEGVVLALCVLFSFLIAEASKKFFPSSTN